MHIVSDKISIAELRKMSEKMFGTFIKAVVDIEKRIMVVDAIMHVDQETLLLEEHGSKQENLWGINFHPNKEGEHFIEFDSMINFRPSSGNRSRGVDNPYIQEKIRAIVTQLVTQ